MSAKPILDIAAGHPRGTPTQDYVAAFERAGYQHRGERGVPGRQFFSRGQPKAYHVHLVFRDYLRAHPEAARDFAVLELLRLARDGA